MPNTFRKAALTLACALTLAAGVRGGQGAGLLTELPATAVASLSRSLEAAGAHRQHVWRDTPPFAADGLVNAYIEIPRGERRKFEFDMRANRREIDRVLPEEIGGYPVNYGFVPQTVSYDGDPFDVLVLGPPLPGGQVVRSAIIGLMRMEDEKGLDSKVVVSPVDERGRARIGLDDRTRERIADYFRRYKEHEPGAFSRVPGWGSADDGRAWVEATHAFFQECRGLRGPCRLPTPEAAGASDHRPWAFTARSAPSARRQAGIVVRPPRTVLIQMTPLELGCPPLARRGDALLDTPFPDFHCGCLQPC